MVFMNPRPEASEQLKLHEDMEFYTPERQVTHQEALFPGYHAALGNIEKYCTGPGKRLLDVGCGIGGFLKCAQDRGWSIMGTEGSSHLADFASSYLGIEVLNRDNVEDLLPDDEQYDAITTLHVLEHVPDPLKTLQQLVALLKPGGVFLGQVPNQLYDAWSRLPLIRERMSAQMAQEGTNLHHLSFFAPRTFRRLFEQAGLEILAEATYAPSNVRGMANARHGIVRLMKRSVYSVARPFRCGPALEIYARKA